MKLLTAVTGASGLPLAVRFLQVLGNANIERHLVVSQHADWVCKKELAIDIDWQTLCEYQYNEGNIAAPVCSGSYPLDAMVVIPCSMNSLAHIASGMEHNLITRAAAVNLKQERRVVLVPRETPLSLLHIENMRQAKLAGCSILPPTLAFYFSPKTINELIDYNVGRVLEILKIPHDLYPYWEGERITANTLEH